MAPVRAMSRSAEELPAMVGAVRTTSLSSTGEPRNGSPATSDGASARRTPSCASARRSRSRPLRPAASSTAAGRSATRSRPRPARTGPRRQRVRRALPRRRPRAAPPGGEPAPVEPSPRAPALDQPYRGAARGGVRSVAGRAGRAWRPRRRARAGERQLADKAMSTCQARGHGREGRVGGAGRIAAPRLTIGRGATPPGFSLGVRRAPPLGNAVV